MLIFLVSYGCGWQPGIFLIKQMKIIAKSLFLFKYKAFLNFANGINILNKNKNMWYK